MYTDNIPQLPLQPGMMFAICCCHFCGVVFVLASHILSEPMVEHSLIDLGFTSHAIDRCKAIIWLIK